MFIRNNPLCRDKMTAAPIAQLLRMANDQRYLDTSNRILFVQPVALMGADTTATFPGAAGVNLKSISPGFSWFIGRDITKVMILFIPTSA
jgi:hypothetical protein